MASGSGGMRTRIVGAGDIKRTAGAMHKMSAEIQGLLTQAIRDTAEPVLADLRRAARTIPDVSDAKRSDGKSLRTMFASAVMVKVTANGVSIELDASKLPAGGSKVAKAFESGSGTFRHPVFGGNTWVTQKSHPWFRPTMRLNEPKFRTNVMAVLDVVGKALK